MFATKLLLTAVVWEDAASFFHVKIQECFVN